GVDAEVLYVVELAHQAAEVADAVVVAVEERAHVHFVDDGVLVPKRVAHEGSFRGRELLEAVRAWDIRAASASIIPAGYDSGRGRQGRPHLSHKRLGANGSRVPRTSQADRGEVSLAHAPAGGACDRGFSVEELRADCRSVQHRDR